MGSGTYLTLNLLTTTIVAAPSNASKWQMRFNSAFKGLKKLSNFRKESCPYSLLVLSTMLKQFLSIFKHVHSYNH